MIITGSAVRLREEEEEVMVVMVMVMVSVLPFVLQMNCRGKEKKWVLS